MADFRALCEELADELTQFNAWYIEDNGYGLPNLEALLRRCDAALAEQPVELSDEELWAIWDPHDGPIPAVLRAAIAADRAANARWGQL